MSILPQRAVLSQERTQQQLHGPGEETRSLKASVYTCVSLEGSFSPLYKPPPILIVHAITESKSDKGGLQEAKLKEPALVSGEHTGAARTGCPQREKNSRRDTE